MAAFDFAASDISCCIEFGPDLRERDWPRLFSEVVVERRNGDVEVCLSWSGQTLPSARILFSAPTAYCVTQGDIVHQDFVQRSRKQSLDWTLVYQVASSGLLESFTSCQNLDEVTRNALKHYVVTSDDEWVHVVCDEKPVVSWDQEEL